MLGILIVIIVIVLGLDIGGSLTTIKGLVGLIRTNGDFRDLTGIYRINKAQGQLNNVYGPQEIRVAGSNQGVLLIMGEWKTPDNINKKIDLKFTDKETALRFINHKESNAIKIAQLFRYKKDTDGEKVTWDNTCFHRITLEDGKVILRPVDEKDLNVVTYSKV